MYKSNKRPTFLTVLCILSFISGAITILSAIYTYSSMDKTLTATQKSIAQLEDSGIEEGFIYELAVKSVEKIVIMSENITFITSTSIFFATFSILGAYLMFKLQKNGFYIYCLSSIISLAPGIYLFGIIDAIVGIVIILLFIFLYTLNLKHLK